MRTSIIIVNYNSRPSLERCLGSITKNTHQDYELIVVDNHSTDDSGSFLSTIRNARLKVIQNPTNLGFAKACNQGLEIASGKILVTMNPDLIVPPNWLSRLVFHLTSNPKTLVVGPKSMGIGGKQWAGPLAFSSRLTAADRKFSGVYHRESMRAKFLIGCLLLFDRRLIEKIGYFDENLPLGADDFDLSLRARKAGYDLRIACDLLVEHTVHASFQRSDPIENERLASLSWSHFNRKWAVELEKYGWERLFMDEAPVFPHEKRFLFS